MSDSIPVFDNLACRHQWFEVRSTFKDERIVCNTENHGMFQHERTGMEGCYKYVEGVLVQCANCEQTKELFG